MKNETLKNAQTKVPGMLYAAAYRTHHMLKDLKKALVLYKEIIYAHPRSKEAGYAQSQVRDIEGKANPRPARSETLPDKASPVSEAPNS